MLPFARPSLGTAEEDAAVRVIRTGWLTTGPEALAFEQELAAAVGAKHVVAVNSCTAALHIAVVGLVPPGSEVITTPLTFASSVASVVYGEAIPVLVDVAEDDLTIDPDRVSEAITERTTAILAVDYGGQPARIGDLRTLAATRGLALIEDAAHSLGATVDGVRVGSLADATCFSFYATKNITTGEGGAIATENDRLAAVARELRLHGMSADAWKRYLPGGSATYDIARIGFKYNLPDLCAAVGRAQLAREPELRAARRAIALTYGRELTELEPSIRLPRERAGSTHAWHLYAIRVNSKLIDRDTFIAALRAEGIATSVHFRPVHRLTAYAGTRRGGHLTQAELAGSSLVSLPIWPSMSEGDASDVVAAVRKVVRHYAS